MPPVYANILGSLLRKGLVALGAIVIDRGWSTADEWDQLVLGLVPVLIGVLWSWWNKWQTRHGQATLL
jgi:membrane protein DedA with SNARE-associated domain